MNDIKFQNLVNASFKKKTKQNFTYNKSRNIKYLNANNVYTAPLLEYLFHMHFGGTTTKDWCHF